MPPKFPPFNQAIMAPSFFRDIVRDAIIQTPRYLAYKGPSCHPFWVGWLSSTYFEALATLSYNAMATRRSSAYSGSFGGGGGLP